VPESFASRRLRWMFNLFPAYRGTGGRVTYISGDFREARVVIPLNWRTRNYVGTIFGGSLYGAVDPIYMILLIRILGKGYTVWDKAASIRFRKPGRGRLSARFHLEEEEIAAIRELCERERSVDRVYNIEIVDSAGEPHAVVEKTINVRKRAQEPQA
jgi:uncharacterized protein DUF4442